jgi:preprotein translocase subunit SecA
VLTAPDLRDQVSRMIQEEIGRLVAAHVSGSNSDDLDLRGLHQELLTFLPLPPEADPVRWAKMAPDEIEAELCEMAESLYGELNHKLAGRWLDQLQTENATLQSLSESADPLRRLAYERILDRLGPDPAPDLLDTPIRKLTPQVRSEVEAGFEDSFRLYRDRRLMLGAVDNLWVRHLTTLASVREGIGLRAYGQQNPLVSYRKESYEMYEALLASIQQTVARSAYLVARPAAAQPAAARPQRRRAQQGRSRQAARGAPDQLPGRNDPCWCGSGVKYKNCHMRLDREQQPRAAAVRPPRAAPGKKGNRRRRRRS